MKYVSGLTEADQAALEQLHLHGPTARQRQRAHAVLLSSQGYTIDQLADILRSDRDTISGWLDQWQKQGLNGLADAPKSGRRRKIDASLETLLRDILIKNPSPNMKAILQAELKKKGKQVCWDTVKRCLKRLGFTFRRARRVPPKSPPASHQARVKRALARFHALEAAGKCQVLYGDESGFCLSPSVPYLWQQKGQTVGLPAQAHSRRLNVLGFLSKGTNGKDSHLHSFQTREKITAAFVIQSIEALLLALPHPTVLVLDNATVHRSKLVRAKRKEWKQKGLRLLFLPPYCPHLNVIEILWRMIKYHWLDCEAYTSFSILCQSVADILAQVGEQYRISFV